MKKNKKDSLEAAKLHLDFDGATNIRFAIKHHFDGLEKLMPTTEDALLFMDTESAEAKELLLACKPYVRNHPENKERYSKERFSEELGDVIYMAMVASATVGMNPLQSIQEKMEFKIHKELIKEAE